MRFIIKNITGDPLNPNVDLRSPKTLYASNDAQSNVLPIGPGDVRSISSKGYTELMKFYAEFIEVIDADGSVDPWAPFRLNKVLEPDVWTFIDFGRVSNYVEIYNDGPVQVKWSCSGYTAPATEPENLSDLDVGEMLSFVQTMRPMQFFYAKAIGGQATIKIFVS